MLFNETSIFATSTSTSMFQGVKNALLSSRNSYWPFDDKYLISKHRMSMKSDLNYESYIQNKSYEKYELASKLYSYHIVFVITHVFICSNC